MAQELTGEAQRLAAPSVDTHPAQVLNRARLHNLAALALVAAAFAYGAWSWVQFFAAPPPLGTGSDRTLLFTQTDYPAVVLASRMVSSGQGAQLYDLDRQLEGQRQLITEGYLQLSPSEPLLYPYPYAPFVAIFNTPLAGISPLAAMAVWDLLNIACMALGLWLLVSALPLDKRERLLILLGGLTCFPFIVNLEQGQSSGLTVLSMGAGIALLRRGNDLQGGLALGLLALKIQWLPFFVLVLLFKRRWRALLGLIITGAALLLLAVLTMGTAWIPGFLDMLQRAQRFDPVLALAPLASHSLSGQLAVLFFSVDGPVTAAGNEAIRNISLLATLFGAALVLWVWRGPWRPGAPAWDGAMSLTVLVAAFTNIQLNTHDLSLLTIPAALGVSYFKRATGLEQYRMAWYGIVVVLYLVTTFLFSTVFSLPVRITSLLIALMLLTVTLSLLRTRTVHETQNSV